jgi:hypothetical protein
MCRRPEMGYPYGTVDGGRSRIGAKPGLHPSCS